MPIDHEYFKSTNQVQWLWYNYQDIQDQRERIEESRDFIEYHASFLAPELVSKVMEHRNKAIGADRIIAGTTSDAEFSATVKNMFGRDPGIAKGPQEMHEVEGVVDRIKEYHERQRVIQQTSSYLNYRHWANYNLE